MPAKIIPQKNGKYTVRTPNGIKGSDMTLEDAQKQQRLLNAIEYGNWHSTKKK